MSDVSRQNRAAEAYGRSMELLTEAAGLARNEGIGAGEFVSALLDFTTALVSSTRAEKLRHNSSCAACLQDSNEIGERIPMLRVDGTHKKRERKS